MHLPVAVQLYTVRDAIAVDWQKTLRDLAAMGYTGVELAGYDWATIPELKSVLDACNMRVVGAHVGLEVLEASLDEIAADQRALDNQMLVISWTPGGSTLAEWQALAGRINQVGKACQALGMHLCYHNHAHELTLVDGKPGLE